MLINLSEIMSVKKKIKHIEATLELKSFELDGIKYEIASKSLVDLTISHVGNRKITIDVSAKVSILIPCSRCLDDVETVFDINVSKKLDFSETEIDRIKEMDETNYIEGYDLNVDLLVYDEILIDFPMKVLCTKECKGICNVCGTNQNKEVCDCYKSVGDPRMSAIQDIFKNSLK
jgi:uncharacterized protein